LIVTITRAAILQILLVVLLSIAVSGCEVIGGIFKAGFWVGAVVVILIAAVIMFIVAKARG
jgi:hypothetical protein